MNHLIDQFFCRLVLLQRGVVQLAGLPAQLFCHIGKANGGGAEARDSLVHGSENGVQTVTYQSKITFIIHLRFGFQITVCDLRQYLTDIQYVLIDAFYRVVESHGHKFQFISGVDGNDLCMQITVRKQDHTFCNAFYRA